MGFRMANDERDIDVSRPGSLTTFFRRHFPGCNTPYSLLTTAARAVALRSGLTLEIFFGLVTVFGVVYLFYEEQHPVLAGTALALLVLWAVAAIIMAFFGLHPDEWARIQVSSRDAEHHVRANAALAIALLENFYHSTRRDAELFDSMETFIEKKEGELKRTGRNDDFRDLWNDWRDKQRGERDLYAAGAFLHRKRRHFLLLERLKAHSAKELRVPLRRFCDHVLQASPVLLIELAHKYQQNWIEVLSSTERLQNEGVPRLVALVRENRTTRDRVADALERLAQLRDHSQLADDVIRMASCRSTSSSVRYYALALESNYTKHRSRSPWSEAEEDCWKALSFIWSRRHSRAGVDVNRLLIRLLTDRIPHADDDTKEWIAECVAVLEHLGTGAESHRGRSTHEDRPRLRDSRLGYLGFILGSQSRSCTDGMTKQFKKFLEEVSKGADDRRIHIVTHAFSRNVRDVITGLGNQAPRVRTVTVLVSPSEESLEARFMLYELKRLSQELVYGRQRTKPPVSEQRRDLRIAVSAAGADFVFEAAEPNDIIIAVVGAEAWSKRPSVLHTRGLGDIAELVRAERRRRDGRRPASDTKFRLFVVVIGEEYKRVPSVRDTIEFFEDDNDHIDLHGPGVIDAVISEKKIYRSSRYRAERARDLNEDN